MLDSPVPVDGLDGYDQLRTLGTPRVLKEVCFPGPCDATVRDPDAALTAAVERLRRGSIRGPLVAPDGRVTTARVSEGALYNALSQSDVLPPLRAGLPAAIASLAKGDAAPFLHLGALLTAETGGEEGVNTARLLATSCIEGRLPWAPDSPVASREDAVEAFLSGHADAFAPFSSGTVLSASLVGLCENWPPTPRPEAVSYLGPDVPVLVVSGRADLRTPLEDARRTALQYPNAQRAGRAGRRPLGRELGPERVRGARHGRVPARPGGRGLHAHLARRGVPEPVAALHAGVDLLAAPDRRLRPRRAGRSRRSR